MVSFGEKVKIDILCGSGSPDGVTPSDIHGANGRVGVGGAELALLTICEGWHKRGYEVTLYNNPKRNDGTFEQRAVNSFDKNASRDVLIVFREPTQKVYKANGRVVFWSCDQYTTGDFAHFNQFAEKTVTISPFHSEYFAKRYEIRSSIPIDLPVRSWEYDSKVEKIPNRIIFTSVPDRGLELVAAILPKLQKRIPDISLVVTSDYRLWGCATPMNNQHMSRFISAKNTQFLGAVPRSRLVEEQLKAQIHLFPCTYDELFCISCAESQVAGALPITSDTGALRTTNMGVVINGDPRQTMNSFVEKTVEYLQSPELPEIQRKLSEKAKERFSLDRILDEWDTKVFG